MSVPPVNQQDVPEDFDEAGASWRILGTYQISSDTLTVRLAPFAKVTTYTDEAIRADAVHVVRVAGDRGPDGDFHLMSDSPAIDAGELDRYYLSEPLPNGGRLNLGAYGNTPEAAASPEPMIQVVEPNGLEKLEINQPFVIRWHSAGLTENQPVALINAGGPTVGSWLENAYQIGGLGAESSLSVDVGQVVDPPPEEVYDSWAYLGPGETSLRYQLPVPDGTYDLRLHFVEPLSYTQPGDRVFDILLQGTVVRDDYDIVADAGGSLIAVTQGFSVTAAGGEGISLELAGATEGYYLPILSGIELMVPSASGVAEPTADVEVSYDGGNTWEPLQENVPIDRYGRGSLPWTPQVEADEVLIRVTANDATQPWDVCDDTFLIANDGQRYYVNVKGDSDFSDNEYTTGAGSDRNSGKRPDVPLASLPMLLRVYDLGPGDVVYVDTGTYEPLTNILLGAEDAGVTIEGPASPGHAAVFDRGSSTGYAYVFELVNADDVTIAHLHLTGAQTGIYATNSDRVTIAQCDVFANAWTGVDLPNSNDSPQVVGNRIYDNGYFGINLAAPRAVVRGNELYGNTGWGISMPEARTDPDQPTLIEANLVHDNGQGIQAMGQVLVSRNTVYNHEATGVLLYFSAAASDNVVYDNTVGIYCKAYNYYDTRHGGVVSGNRVFNNSEVGIRLALDSAALNNLVYSNPVGIHGESLYYWEPYGWQEFYGQIAGNVVHDNANQGILLDHAMVGARIVNNTVYQPVGDAVRIQDQSQDVVLRNNILWVDTGYDLSVGLDSYTGLDSDWNLFHQGSDPDAHVGLWGSTIADALADWQAVSGLDGRSLEGDPLFVDIDGADNVLGYDPGEGGYDGGADDNFYVSAGSPAIDAASTWDAPRTDFFGALRSDDPVTPNSGTPDNWYEYQEVVVTGVDDALADGPVGYTILSAPAASADPRYDGLDAPDVTAVNEDDDRADIVRLTDNEQEDSRPMIDGGQVVWVREVDDPAGTLEVYLYDGSTTYLGLAIDTPKFQNGQLAWTGGSWDAPEVYFYDGTATRVLGAGQEPELDGGQVAWVDYAAELPQVYLYDGTDTVLLGPGYGPIMDAGQVAWRGPSGDDPWVYFYDGTTVRPLGAVEGVVPLDWPQLESGRVVWTGSAGSDRQVYYFDGTSVVNLGPGLFPQLDSGQVAWYDPITLHIRFYNGSTTYDLGPGDAQFDLHGGLVAWFDNTSETPEVYLYDGAVRHKRSRWPAWTTARRTATWLSRSCSARPPATTGASRTGPSVVNVHRTRPSEASRQYTVSSADEP